MGSKAKGHTDRFEVSEGDKLHNVPEDRLALGRAQDPVIPVQDLHISEVGVAHAHDDNGQRLIRPAHNSLPCVGHVCHHSVGKDQQDVISLQ